MKSEIVKDILKLVDDANGETVDFAPIITKHTEGKELTEQDSIRSIIQNVLIELYNDREIEYPHPHGALNITGRSASDYFSSRGFTAATKKRIKEQQEKNPPYNDFQKQCNTVLQYLFENYNKVGVLQREQVYLETGIPNTSPVYEFLKKRLLIKGTMNDIGLDVEGYALMSAGTNLAIAFSPLHSVGSYTDNSTHINDSGNVTIKDSHLFKARVNPMIETITKTIPNKPKRSPIEIAGWIFTIITGSILVYEFILKNISCR